MEKSLDIKVINNYLKEGKSVKEIRGILGIGEKSFQNQIREMGYMYLAKDKKYLKKPKLSKIKSTIKSTDNSSNTPVIQEANTDVITIKDKNVDLEKIADLVNNYDKIKELLSWFDNKENKEYDNSIIEVIPNNDIKIELDTEETKRTTILVNTKVYEDFNEFCKRHNQYNKKDLLSMALKEYMQKYD